MTTKKELIENVEEVFGVKVMDVKTEGNEILFFCEDGKEPIRLPQEKE